MNSYWFRVLAVVFAATVLSLVPHSTWAQGNGGGKGGGGGGGGGGSTPPPTIPWVYRTEYKAFPIGTTQPTLYGVANVNGNLIAVGSYVLNGVTRGFIYDHGNDTWTDLFDFFGVTSSCREINSNGLVIGNLLDGAGTRHVYWLDYQTNPLTLHILDQQFPELAMMDDQMAAAINNGGDIVIGGYPSRINFVVNPFTSAIAEFDMLDPIAINDFGIVVGSDNLDGPIYRVARWHPVLGKEVFEGFKMQTPLGDVNNFGEFGVITDKDNSASGTPCRIGNQVDWTGPVDNAYYVSSLNDEGDLSYMAAPAFSNNEKCYFYHATRNQVYKIDDLTSDQFLKNSRQFPSFITERDMTMSVPTSTLIGNAQNDSTGDSRLFFLFPGDGYIYSCADTPKSIPDNNTTGITSTIAVTEAVTIANLTVTLNISHPRISDLQATLIGPNNVSVPLANLTGLNDVGNFDGGSSAGNWRVKVVDTVRKQSGTLNGWTLTIEY